MKNILKKTLFSLALIPMYQLAQGQDTLSLDDISSYYYKFQIQDGQIRGEGAEFLMNEFSKHQVVMLGEYHNQKSISEFTTSIIPILNKEKFKHLALEVGPTMGEFLNSLNSPSVEGRIKTINRRYQIKDGDDIYTPIPFFEHVEDARFLDLAKKYNWNVFGVDQEYYDSYPLLFDLMFENLDEKEKLIRGKLFQSAKDTLNSYYQREMNNDESYTTLISDSKTINDFLEVMKLEEVNKPITEALLKSIEIYKMNDDKKWFENYQSRITYMKYLLKKELVKEKFDIQHDKLLIKMGRLHLSRGISPYGFNEIGNTLHELAEYNGVTALGIGFETRFHTEKNEITDELDSGNSRIQNYKEFKKFGDKDEWVILDLRPIRKDFHWYPYPLKNKLNIYLQKLITNYDILIIAPAYNKPTPNY